MISSSCADKLRDVASDRPARFNSDPEYLHDGAGCTGKLAVFAVRLPTFEACEKTSTVYIAAAEPGAAWGGEPDAGDELAELWCIRAVSCAVCGRAGRIEHSGQPEAC